MHAFVVRSTVLFGHEVMINFFIFLGAIYCYKRKTWLVRPVVKTPLTYSKYLQSYYDFKC